MSSATGELPAGALNKALCHVSGCSPPGPAHSTVELPVTVWSPSDSPFRPTCAAQIQIQYLSLD
jgi:hypothetical protein